MTASNVAPHRSLKPQGFRGSFELSTLIALDEGTTAIPGYLFDDAATDWSYESSGAENLGGEVAVAGWDLDGQAGLVYAGPAGGTIEVSFDFISSSALNQSPEATDSFNVGVFRDNELMGVCNEGWTNELDAASLNATGTVRVDGLLPGHVVRVALMSHEGNEDDVALTIDDYAQNSLVVA